VRRGEKRMGKRGLLSVRGGKEKGMGSEGRRIGKKKC